ncbi:MAG TPA: ABC transporter ATP-binding protein [Alphaproteobacteria bacterium]|nr:ABC transporter ATP-binding protein [Alphaproteobacteria bacterium]
MEKNIYRFILKYSFRDQIVLLVATAISFPFLYYSYDLPKLVVNHIKDVGQFAVRRGRVDTYPLHSLLGVDFDAVGWLMVLSLAYLALVIVNGAFKYFINVFKGRLGERMLRRLRYALYSRIICFPLPHFKKISAGELIPMITGEVEPLGGFIGDAFVTPLFQGGLLIVPLFFILMQNPWLGLAAVALYPIQGYLIPKLQRRVNQLGKERILRQRKLSDRIGETVNGIVEIRANDTSRYERADFSARLGVIYRIRFKIYVLKFLVKYINNTFDKFTPFFFFSIGGYLVFHGRLDLGALVAVINAQKDLASPWRELLDYYQSKEDARIKYEQVVEQFAPPDMIDERVQFIEPEKIEPLAGDIVATNLSLTEDGRIRLLDNVSFRLPLATHVAVVGVGASGKEELAQVMARLLTPTGGKLTIGEQSVAELPDAVSGRRLAYVGQNAYLLSGTVRDNLLYSLKHKPRASEIVDPARKAELAEAARTGNLALDVDSDWIDYEGTGAARSDELAERELAVLRLAEMEEDIYQLGLRGVIDPLDKPALAASILQARQAMRERLDEPGIAKLVEVFDVERFNSNASVGENLLFGTPVGPAFDMDRLAENRYVLAVLEEVGLVEDMLAMGRETAATMVELFADLPPGSELFEQYSFISADDLAEFQALLTRIDRGSLANIRAEDRTRLLNLPFKLVEARHRLDLIDDGFKARLLQARQVFAKKLPPELAGAVAFFEAGRYNAAATIQENVLFGKLAYGQAHGAQHVGALIREVLEALGLRGTVMGVGLESNVGTAGSRLVPAQRQKLAIARAVLKRPDLLVLNDALAPLDSSAQSKLLDSLRAEFKGRGLFCVLNRVTLARNFDRVLVMRAGKIVEQGSFDALNREGTAFREFLQAE